MNFLRLWLCLCMFCLASPAWANAGAILNILGSAKIQKKTGQLSPAIKGDILYEGDAVRAETNSNVQIRMADGAMVWVRANSELKIEGYKSTDRGGVKDEASLKLVSGSMRTVTGLIAKKNPDNYRLSTPSATIGVRGTEFDAVYVTPANAALFKAESGTYNRVYQGSTRLKSGQQDITVAEGQAAFVGSAGGAPQMLQKIPDFLNLPANATRSYADTEAQAPPAPVSAREQVRISVRYGSTSSKVGEASLKLDVGTQTWVPLQQLVGANTLLVGSERLESSQLTVAMSASSAKQAPIVLQIGDLQMAGRPGMMGQYKLSLSLTPGSWQEVTDRGPWLGISKAKAQSATRFDLQNVYIMADQAR